MNINQAKEYIKNSIHMYLKKDEYGDYKIPVVRQRPIFLLGAPGIGKTAIMEVQEEYGIEVHPIVTVLDIHEYLKENGTDPELLKDMEAYMAQYCVF